MLNYQRVAYFWKHPHVFFHCSSKKPARCSSFRIPWHPELETTSESWHGTARVTTTGTLYLTGQHRCQTENKWMSKHVKNCHNPIDIWHGGWMFVGLSSFVGFFSMWEKQFLLRKTWSPGGKPHPMIGNNSWFRTSTTRTFAVSIGTRTTTKVLDVKILIVVSNYNKNVSFTCY